MLGIHVRKQALRLPGQAGTVVPLSATHDPPVTGLRVTPPPNHDYDWGQRSCPETGPANTAHPSGEATPLEANGGVMIVEAQTADILREPHGRRLS